MGNTWGSKLARTTADLHQLGEGRSMAPADMPRYSSVTYKSWARGIVNSVSPENMPEDAGRDVQDILIDRDGSLIRSPGITEVEDVTPRLLRWLFVQSSLDYTAELVAIDAPYLGYKGTGAFIFANAGIAAPGQFGWNAVNVLGVLLFSDGSHKTYTRAPGAAVVTDISADIIARTFANAFGRTFAGAYDDPITGFQSLAIKWNGTSGLVNDWAGLGSGVEELVSNALEADKIVALRPIGFDALGILCRKSLWIGYPTGQADRPADFRIRSVGLGCVCEPAATISPAGIAFLSDEGVVIYDQNNISNISGDINADLLPIDYTQLDRYRMLYIPNRDMLILQTPTESWFYEFQSSIRPARWTKRSFALDNIAIFTDQSGNVFWTTVAGSWAAQTLTWNEMVGSQDDAAPAVFFASGSKLGEEDATSESYFGGALASRWETRNSLLDDEGKQVVGTYTEQVTTLGFEIEYSSSVNSEITIETPDHTGEFTNSLVQALISTGNKRKRAVIWKASTGMGVKCRYNVTSGFLRLHAIRQIVQDSGPVIGSAT